MRRHRPSAVAVAAALAAGLATPTIVSTAVEPTPAAAATTSPVIGKRVIGYSVRHRPIVAYHLGNPKIRRTTLVIGQMHGDEHAGVRVARALLHGRRVAGLNLWVIPSINPDGDKRGTRKNAHGVDLNRNFPYRWARLSGQYYSGRKPLSEPESRAVYRFLRKLRPHYVVSVHQPLNGVDSGDGGALDKRFRNRLARNLHLPVKRFACWSECHGSMTRWYTHHRYGVAITVEFGSRPSAHRLTTTAPRGIVRAMGGRFTE
ncbi:Zinc carboxypeptidase [Jatrophihabitans endophyticus]|uniref:Zinc carboxypeptidase n=1 Tax=Jatrophihabitans endophyticus TaxID=1206085 RepID=A0A1M5DFT7_9ACTN|nr:M14 family zinc carboxypeptidase [Jatrophihabitans endophyticus]SHF65751.1 Zinc carboxypeptidase [Jatrophihabitans endophyticus]